MEKMTIHRALSELKLIDARVTNQIDNLIPSGYYQKGKKINGYVDKDEFEKDAQGKFDSINALIQRKISIKTAIVASNGRVRVKIAEKEMSVADAITFKTIVIYKRALIGQMKAKHRNTLAQLNKLNENVQLSLQKNLEMMLGKDNVKPGTDDVENVRRPFLELNEYHLSDAVKVEETVQKLETEIMEFESEVDAVLSESNAITLIEF